MEVANRKKMLKSLSPNILVIKDSLNCSYVLIKTYRVK